MCKFRWTRRTSTLDVWSVKFATNSRLRATSHTKTSPSAKRTTRFEDDDLKAEAENFEQWGMGWQNVWIKMRKVRGSSAQLSCPKWGAGKEGDGEHICTVPVNLCKWESLALHRNGLSKSDGLFQVSHKPCICQSNRLSRSDQNLFSTALSEISFHLLLFDTNNMFAMKLAKKCLLHNTSNLVCLKPYATDLPVSGLVLNKGSWGFE